MSTSVEGLIDRVLADPPEVHLKAVDGSMTLGVWSTDRDCYRLLLSIDENGRTLETGAGVSTILWTACGADHLCVTPSQDEAERILAYCAERGIDTTRLRFEIGASEYVLPGLPRDAEFDAVFIDGNHAFPAPAIDVFYAGSLLRDGGLLVIDDVHLPAVDQLRQFLDRDPRWINGPCTTKWASYRRLGSGSLVQNWWEQSFWEPRTPRWVLRWLRGKLRGVGRRIGELRRAPR